MTGKLILERISSSGITPYVHAGPLIAELLSSASKTLNEYVRAGGYEVVRRILCEVTREQVILLLDEAGLRGRAGGGFRAISGGLCLGGQSMRNTLSAMLTLASPAASRNASY